MSNPSFHNHNYKIIEEKEDWKDAVIEKDNIRATFSVRDFENNIERMEKTIREISAKFLHEQLIVKNIEEHHPFVKDMSDQDVHTVWMYQEAKEVVKQYEPRLTAFEEALKTEKAELEYVKGLLALDKDNG